jgi:hypothetical protein
MRARFTAGAPPPVAQGRSRARLLQRHSATGEWRSRWAGSALRFCRVLTTRLPFALMKRQSREGGRESVTAGEERKRDIFTLLPESESFPAGASDLCARVPISPCRSVVIHPVLQLPIAPPQRSAVQTLVSPIQPRVSHSLLVKRRAACKEPPAWTLLPLPDAPDSRQSFDLRSAHQTSCTRSCSPPTPAW